jgi:GH25 family lysozyme M1 (1,4-beta-N-acetylmuramidase)
MRSVAIANTTRVWGWDASNHDWARGPMDLTSARADGISFFTHKATEGGDWKDPHYKEALERARKAGIPVLGSYHYLWPDPPNSIEAQINFWMDHVEGQTPWWRDVPWIWQIDAEEQGLPRPPTPGEIRRGVAAIKHRMAEERTTAYVIVYAPRWLYGNTLGAGYDLWNSDYSGSGAARPFREQYRGVSDRAHGWSLMSGRTPRILQFASDGVVGRQHTCDVDKFDGDLHTLIRLCGRDPARIGAPVARTVSAD